VAAAGRVGLELDRVIDMPNNNVSIVLRRAGAPAPAEAPGD